MIWSILLHTLSQTDLGWNHKKGLEVMCGSLICVVTLHFFTVADDLTDLTCIFVYFFILVQLQCRNKKFPTFFLSGIIVFLSFFLIFWATIEKFVYENDQLFPKLSNFVSTLLCLSIHNKRVKDLFRVICALKSFAIRNSLNVLMAEVILFRYCGF